MIYTSSINQSRAQEHGPRIQYWTAVLFFGLTLALNVVFLLSIHQPSSKVRIHLWLSLPSHPIFKAGGDR